MVMVTIYGCACGGGGTDDDYSLSPHTRRAGYRWGRARDAHVDVDMDIGA